MPECYLVTDRAWLPGKCIKTPPPPPSNPLFVVLLLVAMLGQPMRLMTGLIDLFRSTIVNIIVLYPWYQYQQSTQSLTTCVYISQLPFFWYWILTNVLINDDLNGPWNTQRISGVSIFRFWKYFWETIYLPMSDKQIRTYCSLRGWMSETLLLSKMGHKKQTRKQIWGVLAWHHYHYKQKY